MNTTEKPLLKVGDKLLVVVGEDGTSVIYKARVCEVGSEHGSLIYKRADKNGSLQKRTGYLREENNLWCRGWTGEAAQALRAATAKTVRQYKQRKAAEQKRYEDSRIEAMQTAMRIVDRAKLPRELRAAAFQITCMGSWGPFGLMR